MIILGVNNRGKSGILMSVPKTEWMSPSRAMPKDDFGNEDKTKFRLRGYLNDGAHRDFWFEDRDDADAFLWAIVTGEINRQPSLWRMPSPQWHPDIGENLTYEFASVTILTTTGSNLTYTSPSDWLNASNSIECIGGAGSGGLGFSTAHGTGGGGGAYSKITNFSFATPGTTTATYRVGSGGASVSATASTVGNAGSVTYFNAAADPGVGANSTKCSAAAGAAGAAGAGSQNGGAGGATTAGWGVTKNAGGRGGNMTGASGLGASGGGGSGGPNGAGNQGVDSTSTSNNVVTAGGQGDGTSGGAGGASAGGAGGNGSEFGTSFGCGGGGGSGAGGTAGGAGGNYGGGGAGASRGTGTGVTGAGIQGLIVIISGTVFLSNHNLPLLGM